MKFHFPILIANRTAVRHHKAVEGKLVLHGDRIGACVSDHIAAYLFELKTAMMRQTFFAMQCTCIYYLDARHVILKVVSKSDESM